LAVLAAAAGISGREPVEAGEAQEAEATGDSPGVADDAVATVLAAVNDAVTELAAERQRRDIHDAAFDNIWRGE
ncbi:GPP34 family phosphoprotein, partial [Streptomyces sp. NPDC054841]